MKWDRVVQRTDGMPVLFIKVLWRGWGRSISIHKIVYPDVWGQFHTHPANAIRLILWGGYVEEMYDGDMRYWRPGMFGRIRPEDTHRINRLIHPRPSYSLWLRGKVTHDIYLKGSGWPIEWQDLPAIGASDTEKDL